MKNRVQPKKAQDTPKTPIEPDAPGSSHPVYLEKRRSYATIGAAQPVEAPSQSWIKVSYENRRNGSKKPSLSGSKVDVEFFSLAKMEANLSRKPTLC